MPCVRIGGKEEFPRTEEPSTSSWLGTNRTKGFTELTVARRFAGVSVNPAAVPRSPILSLWISFRVVNVPSWCALFPPNK